MNLKKALKKIHHLFGNYGLFTMAILLMIGVRPFFNESGEGGILTDLFFMCIFLSGIYAVRRTQYDYWLSIVLAAAGVSGRVHLHLSDAAVMPVFANLASMLFLMHVLYNVAAHIWSRRHNVDHDVIWAAVSAYLLLGLVWGYGYDFIQISNPEAFRGSVPGLNRDDFFYFSYVTLATLGYGDIVPITRAARSVTVLEALTGQLYLAILIARLVGAYASQFRDEK